MIMNINNNIISKLRYYFVIFILFKGYMNKVNKMIRKWLYEWRLYSPHNTSYRLYIPRSEFWISLMNYKDECLIE